MSFHQHMPQGQEQIWILQTKRLFLRHGSGIFRLLHVCYDDVSIL